MISVSKKLSQLVYFHTENNIFKAMPLFQEFTVDLDTQSVTVEVSRKNGIYPKQAKHRYWKLDTIRVL